MNNINERTWIPPQDMFNTQDDIDEMIAFCKGCKFFKNTKDGLVCNCKIDCPRGYCPE